MVVNLDWKVVVNLTGFSKPSKELNEKLIANFVKTFNSNKVLVLLEDAYVSEELLKPILFSALLVSGPVNDKEGLYDGSYLNIVWFGDDFKNTTIEKMIMDLKNFDYEKEAQNYEF